MRMILIQWFRKSVGEEYYKGAVNLITGADVASRIRLTGLLIQENRYNRTLLLKKTLSFILEVLHLAHSTEL